MRNTKKTFNILLFINILLISKIHSIHAESEISNSNRKETLEKIDTALKESTIHGYTSLTISHRDLIPLTKEAIYIQGDLDGDIIRLIHAAFTSGYIEFTQKGYELFIDLIKTENRICIEALSQKEPKTKFEHLIACQKSEEMYEKINNLIKHIKYIRSPYKLVCIGDIIFERFTNNLFAMAELIINLHNHGVVFVKGNHDFIDTLNRYPEIKPSHAAALGFYSKDVETIKNNPTQRKKVTDAIDRFVIAHYDPEFKIFFTHAALGIKNIDNKDYIVYCNELCGPVDSTPEELLKKLQSLSNLISEDMHPWRPKEEAKFKMNDVLLVHGHDGCVDSSVIESTILIHKDCKDILCVNSRLDGALSGVLTVIVKLPRKN